MNAVGYIVLGFLFSSTLSVAGQVRVDKPLELIGVAEMDRQLNGLRSSTDPADVLTAATEQSGLARTALEVTGNLWQVELPAFGAVPVVGSHVVVKVPLTTSGAVSLLLNGAGPYAIMHGGVALDGSSLEEGTMLSLVHDGTAFQVLNGRADAIRSCPTGMVAVNEQYCMETTERPGADFFGAALACAAQDRRLCSWAEFHGACINSLSLGLIGMTNNWEWTNNTSNEDNSGRVVGVNGCTTAGNWISTGNGTVAFRCCASR